MLGYPDHVTRFDYNPDRDDSLASWSVAVSEHMLLNKRVTGEQGAGWLERFNWFDADVPAE